MSSITMTKNVPKKSFIKKVLFPLYLTQIVFGISRFKPAPRLLRIWKYLILIPVITMAINEYIHDLKNNLSAKYSYGIVLEIFAKINTFCMLLVVVMMALEYLPNENHTIKLFQQLEKIQNDLEKLGSTNESVRKWNQYKVYTIFGGTSMVGYTLGTACLFFDPSWAMFSKMVFEKFVVYTFNEFVTCVLLLEVYVKEVTLYIKSLKSKERTVADKDLFKILTILDQIYESIEMGVLTYGMPLLTVFFMIYITYINCTFTSFVAFRMWSQGTVTSQFAFTVIFLSEYYYRNSLL